MEQDLNYQELLKQALQQQQAPKVIEAGDVYTAFKEGGLSKGIESLLNFAASGTGKQLLSGLIKDPYTRASFAEQGAAENAKKSAYQDEIRKQNFEKIKYLTDLAKMESEEKMKSAELASRPSEEAAKRQFELDKIRLANELEKERTENLKSMELEQRKGESESRFEKEEKQKAIEAKQKEVEMILKDIKDPVLKQKFLANPELYDIESKTFGGYKLTPKKDNISLQDIKEEKKRRGI